MKPAGPFLPDFCALFTWPLCAFVFLASSAFAGEPPRQQNALPAIPTAAQDPVSALIKKVQTGTVHLKFDSHLGYLPSLLKALRIPVSSQVLAFSKTSSQAKWTNPNAPRAIYYSDSASVAWQPGAKVIDLAGIDPRLGAVFYSLEQTRAEKPSFSQNTDCLSCHQSRKTFDVPALVMRSVHTTMDGVPLADVHGFVTGHNAPLETRWSGWYVTGLIQEHSHLGNQFISDLQHPETRVILLEGDLLKVRKRLKTAHYLADTSDVVSLLVLEHQLRMQALLTLANSETTEALLHVQTEDNARAREVAQDRIAGVGEMVLSYLLFRDEIPLPDKLSGDSGFVSRFRRQGPRDRKGRSLRELDLHGRLFRYPCSFLIYSDAFDQLPDQMKHYLYNRLIEVLAGNDRQPPYAEFSQTDRRNILEILLDTKKDFKERLGAGPGPQPVIVQTSRR